MKKHWRPLPVLLALVAGCTPTMEDGPGPSEEAAAQSARARVWAPCGSTAHLLRDIRSGPRDAAIHSLVHGDGVLFFAAIDDTHAAELWKSSGTGGAGTSLVRDIAVGLDGSGPTDLTRVGDRLFFIADDEVRGRALWMSDGTASGTRALDEVAPGPAASSPRDFSRSGWDVFFTAETVSTGRELYALPFRPEDACAGARL